MHNVQHSLCVSLYDEGGWFSSVDGEHKRHAGFGEECANPPSDMIETYLSGC